MVRGTGQTSVPNGLSQYAEAQTTVNPLRAVKTTTHRMHSCLFIAFQPYVLIRLSPAMRDKTSALGHGQRLRAMSVTNESECCGEYHVE